MRIRTIKPEFHQNEKLASCSREVRLLAAALLNIADDEGYFRSHPALIAGACFPFDADGQAFVARGLSELQRIGYVEQYEGSVGLVVHFKEHQVINKPTKSKLREKAVTPVLLPESFGELPEQSEKLPHGSGTGNREVEQGSGKEVEVERKTPPPPSGDVRPPVFVVEPPTTPVAEWTAEDFWRWAQTRRQDSGLVAERWPHPAKLSTWWSQARAIVSTEALREAFNAFGCEKHWGTKKPPYPFLGFVSQWEQFVPQGGLNARH